MDCERGKLMLSDNKIAEWRERLTSMIVENYPNRWGDL